MGATTGFQRILVYRQNLNASSGRHISNLLWQEREFVVNISCPTRKPTWEVAGNLVRILGSRANPIFLEQIPLSFDSQVISLPPIKHPYLLGFTPVKWLGSYTIFIWRLPMGIYTDPASGATANEVLSTTVAATNVATGAVILAAKPERKSFTIKNTSTSILYLGYGTVPTATNFTVEIPAKGFFDPNINFSGEIKGLWTNTNGSALVTEFV
jgi:hypothetical protein